MSQQLFEFLKQDIDNLRSDVKSDLREINGKIDEILSFKWKIIGGSVVISAMLSFAVSIIIAIMET